MNLEAAEQEEEEEQQLEEEQLEEQQLEETQLETVKSVTLTQDQDGSIILHCPAQGGWAHSTMQAFLDSLHS